ncbi:L-fucose:H+ symporter permease [Mucilaginibacter sp. Mucisp86]|uniref:L-fucose:H+ symporter permease n=1 Tax=Mucilaginibacter sp. Mucisp86 TaxID=3243060 RepID=UPI0039B3F134
MMKTILDMPKNSYFLPFVLITSLFFLWGFAHNLDPVLIPHLKRSFTLTTTQATLVDSAVFIAYFLMAVPAGMIMKKYGYQKGIIIGLLIFASGCFLFIPAANTRQYSFFLVALFVIATGLTLLETAANPYAAVLGDPETATRRLNLSQSFNGLAAALAPVIGGRLILTKGFSDETLGHLSEAARKAALASEASSVKIPYLVLGLLLILIAVAFAFIKLPVFKEQSHAAGKNIFSAFAHRHLSWAVATQFFYVGAQVCVFSLFILYTEKSAGLKQVESTYYLGLCGIAFLAGRFVSTLIFMRYARPEKLLAAYALINICLCIGAVLLHGMVTVYLVIATCFFMSIMFPTIFSLGIHGLGRDIEYGSSLLVMSIVGGAILPRVFGYISDWTGNIQLGYLVPLGCFLIVFLFGVSGHRISVKKVTNSPTYSQL